MIRVRLMGVSSWIFWGVFGNGISQTVLLVAGIGDLKLVFERDVQNLVAGGGVWGFEACFWGRCPKFC
jgi:hypothetical protein